MVPIQSGGTGVLLVISGAAFLLFAGATLYVYYWLYRDAKTNSPHSAAAWLAVASDVAFLGVILYFPVGRGDPARHDGTPGPGR